jgi:hypothetical protein
MVRSVFVSYFTSKGGLAMAKKPATKRKTRTIKTTEDLPATPQAAAEKTSPGKGKKLCPECDTVCGASQKACTKCGHVFQKKAKKTGGKRGRKPGAVAVAHRGHDTGNGNAAAQFIRESGGIDQAMSILATVKSVVGSKLPF